MKAIVSQKGQVTIPKQLRDRLALRPGTVLHFEAVGGKLVAVKASVQEDPVLAVTGIIEAVGSTEELLEETRGPVE